MGVISTIVVPDAAGTPVNHTFNPVKIDGDTASYLEQSGTSGLSYWTLQTSQRAPLAGQTEKVWRTKLSLSIPVVYDEVINGITRPTLGYVNRVNVEFITSASSVLQNRKDIRKILVGILNDAQFKDMYETQANIYG